MKYNEVSALLKGIVPVIKERFDELRDKVAGQLAERDQTIAALERRVAELEEELTRP